MSRKIPRVNPLARCISAAAGGHKFVAEDALWTTLFHAGNFEPLRLVQRAILLTKLLLLSLKVPPALNTVQCLNVKLATLQDHPCAFAAGQGIGRKCMTRTHQSHHRSHGHQ
jgi:hypothetical protein